MYIFIYGTSYYNPFIAGTINTVEIRIILVRGQEQ